MNVVRCDSCGKDKDKSSDHWIILTIMISGTGGNSECKTELDICNKCFQKLPDYMRPDWMNKIPNYLK